MSRITTVALVIILSESALRAEDNPKAAARQYQKLVDEFEEEGGARRFAKRFLALAEEQPKEAAAVDALRAGPRLPLLAPRRGLGGHRAAAAASAGRGGRSRRSRAVADVRRGRPEHWKRRPQTMGYLPGLQELGAASAVDPGSACIGSDPAFSRRARNTKGTAHTWIAALTTYEVE